MAGIGGFLPPVVAELRADITDFKVKMGEARTEVASMSAEGSANFNKFATVGKAALLGVAAVAVGVAVISVKAAEESQAAHARLTTAIKNSGDQYGAYAERIDHADSAARRLGFDNADLESSLAKLTPVAHGVGNALNLMNLAEDIARGRHIELSAATDILTKVENGRVSMLSRIGINTKDATGATISQEEAIKRLTALYGGSASAYAQTFAGKLATIKAEATFVAEKIGMTLIPIIEHVGSAAADAALFFDRHREAGYALAAVIGGVLVAAIAAYIAKTVQAIALTIATQWGMMIGLVRSLAVGIQLAGAALEAYAGAETLAAVANAAATGSFVGVAAGLGAIVAAVALPVAIIAGVGAAMYFAADAFGYWDDTVSKATTTGERWATGQIKGAIALNDTIAAYKQLSTLNNAVSESLKRHTDAMAKNDEAMQREGATRHNTTNATKEQIATITTEQAAIDRLTAEHGKLGDALDKLRPEYQKLRAEQEQNLLVTKKVAVDLGITIPHAAGMSSAALKVMQTAVKESTGEFGVQKTQALLDLGETGAGIMALVKKTQDMQKGVSDAMLKSTDAFAHFGSQEKVTRKEFEDFFVGSITQSQQWGDEVAATFARFGSDASAGVQTVLNQLAQAGPQGKPALDAFNQMIDEHGVAWVSDMANKGEAARTAMVNSIAQMQFDVEQRLATLRANAAQALRVSVDASAANSALDALEHRLFNMPHSTVAGMPGGGGSAHYNEDGTYAGWWGKGNIFSQPTVIGVGEGGPEIVAPINDPARFWELVRQSGMAMPVNAPAGAMSTPMVGAERKHGDDTKETHYHTHHNEIRIDGSKEPKETAKAVGDFLEGRR